MALLAEEIVEEWLNRQGYFTIRGIRIGVHEIDLLALKLNADRTTECRHIEVQSSMRPVSFISQVPKSLRKLGRAPNSARRTHEELVEGVAEWVEKKFRHPAKMALMENLCVGRWTSELVANAVKSDEELKLIATHGIKIHRLSDVLSSLAKERHVIERARGAEITDLIFMSLQSKAGS